MNPVGSWASWWSFSWRPGLCIRRAAVQMPRGHSQAIEVVGCCAIASWLRLWSFSSSASRGCLLLCPISMIPTRQVHHSAKCVRSALRAKTAPSAVPSSGGRCRGRQFVSIRIRAASSWRNATFRPVPRPSEQEEHIHTTIRPLMLLVTGHGSIHMNYLPYRPRGATTRRFTVDDPPRQPEDTALLERFEAREVVPR